MYPNPAQSQVTFEFAGATNNSVTIRILDLAGKVVSETTITEASGPKSVNLTDVQKGMFLVQIIDKNGALSAKKLVIE